MEKRIKYIGLFLFIALISLTTVLAELNVKYTVYEGELDSSGSLTKKLNTISGFNVNVPCNNDACTSVGALIPSLSTTSLSDNVTIPYPHEMLTTHGYALYFTIKIILVFKYGMKKHGELLQQFIKDKKFICLKELEDTSQFQILDLILKQKEKPKYKF